MKNKKIIEKILKKSKSSIKIYKKIKKKIKLFNIKHYKKNKKRNSS